MFRAMLFLPSHIRLLTKRVTSLSLKRGSGAKGIFLGCVLRMSHYFVEATKLPFNELYLLLIVKLIGLLFGFRFLGTVFRPALLTVFYTCSIEATTNNVVTYTW